MKTEPDSDNKLRKVSAIDCFQIRSTSTVRFIKKMFFVSSTILDEVKAAVKAVMDTD